VAAPLLKILSLSHRNAALQQNGPDLIDDARALADQPFPYSEQCLQVELVCGLRGHELIVGRCIASGIGSASRKSILLSL
jgi:hypothetical protein